MGVAARLAAVIFGIGLCLPARDIAVRRRESLDTLLRILPPSRTPPTGRLSAHENTWEAWLQRTGELPPDFDRLASTAALPDPLMLEENGGSVPVTTPAQWTRKRQWIRSQFEHWVFGHMPPPPGNMRAVPAGTSREGTVTVRNVRLEFGPGRRASLRLQLIVPDGPGPFPVFLTDHARNRPWLYTAVRRGYLVCVYYASDPIYGDADDSDPYIDLYPGYDFSCLARWAWAGSRAVDFLYTLPEVDKSAIGLAGHSRNGKQALLAAAFDDRIGAVIPSSGNTGECDPWRYTTDMFANESIQLLTGAKPHWFHPRLRFFAGREDKLPLDQNLLLAMVAPRGLMMYAAYSESAGNPLGFEQAYLSARRVYRFLGHEERIWLHLRDGEHDTSTVDVENFLDFFDTMFGRKTAPKAETLVLGYNFDQWRRQSGDRVDPLAFPPAGLSRVASVVEWQARKEPIRRRISWALGEPPPRVPFPGHSRVMDPSLSSDGWLAAIFNRPTAAPDMGIAPLPFGDGLKGDLYYPLTPGGGPKPGRWPVVIWLHPYTYQSGWSASSPWTSRVPDYVADQRPSFQSLVRRGFAVLAFDQLGFGTRIREMKPFYNRYPHWSVMGNMVADTRAAIDALAALEEIDSSRIYLLGYALGAKVGLLTAAFDERVHGVAAVCGFDPLRLASADKGTEGLGHYSHLHGLIPRLGFFIGHEDRVPFDFDEVVAMIAPRPVLLVAPTMDRYARIEDVLREVQTSRGIYRVLGAENRLKVETPVDFNRFPKGLQESVFDWLRGD